MKIQINNIKNTESFELSGHDAPILGLSLDPKEEFLVSYKFRSTSLNYGNKNITI